jgi:hypothetical protein
MISQLKPDLAAYVNQRTTAQLLGTGAVAAFHGDINVLDLQASSSAEQVHRMVTDLRKQYVSYYISISVYLFGMQECQI